MANPQPDKYTRLSNELLEAIMRSDFSKRQLNILFLIWRCSYGFNRKVAKLKKSDFQYVGVYPADITKELKYLKETKVIFWDEENNLIAFNKDYDRWRISLSRSVVEGKVEVGEILKRQFEEFGKTLNEDIGKILNLPVDNSEKVGKTPNTNDEKFSKTLSENNARLGKILTSGKVSVSKTLNAQFSRRRHDKDDGSPKDIKHKEINNTSSSNGNIRNNAKDKRREDEEENKSKIPQAFFKAFNQMITPFQMQMLQSYIEDGIEE
ncbi:MAG: replication protein, partial [Bacteroidota bacterium]